MKGAKVHSGVLKTKSVKADGKIVHNLVILKPGDLELSADQISGTIAASAVIGHTGKLSLPCILFSGTIADDDPVALPEMLKHVGFTTVVPSNIPADIKLDVKLYWTTSGVWTNLSGVGVVWDLDYRTIEPIVSGALVVLPSNRYVISGNFSNTTVTDNYVGGAPLMSGALNTTILSIPASDIKAGKIIQAQITRDLRETENTMMANVSLLYVVLEYIEDRSD